MITPKEIVDFSVDYICDLFENNGDERGVLHDKPTLLYDKKALADDEKTLMGSFNFIRDNGGVLHAERIEGDEKYYNEKKLMDGEKALVDHFKFSLDGKSEETTYCLVKLFRPAYWIFLENYALRDDGFPNGGGNHKSEKHYWDLRNGIPDRDEFKDKVLKKYRPYLEANLGNIQFSL